MKINEYCKNLYSAVEQAKTNKLEKIAFIFFCFFVILVSFFHEPWFDEFQSWGISKDSLYNILFVIPHYEGHTPLWYLIIKCFSIFNVNPELCLKIPNLVFTALGTWILIFKSPFPRTVRLLLPFTYFIFYQYGVISRPYSLFYLALMLCAACFNTRNTKPFRYACILSLLALSSVQGLALTAGITIAWGLEQLDFKNIGRSFISYIKSRQFFASLILFAICAVILVCIFPNGKNTALSLIAFLTLWQKILFCLFGIISESLIFNLVPIHTFMSDFFDNSYNVIYGIYFILSLCFGLFVLVFLTKILNKTKTSGYFLIPYIIFSTMFYAYYNSHNSGLLFLVIIFCLWISYDKLILLLSKKEKCILKILTVLVLSVQLIWGFASGYEDIFTPYDISRAAANYILKHELYKYKVFAGGWNTHYYLDESGKPVINDYIIRTIDNTNDKRYKRVPADFNNMHLAVITIPYFNKNIYYNFNTGFEEKLYSLHKAVNDAEMNDMFQKWREYGLPDVIIGKVNFKEVYGNEMISDDYILIENFSNGSIWKGFTNKNSVVNVPLYLHKDLYKKLDYKKYLNEEK